MRIFAEPSSFIAVGKSGQIPWRFVGLSGCPSPKILAPRSDLTWETILPISPKFDSLGAAHPGFLDLRSEDYTLQLICDLEWELPTNWFSESVQAAVLANEFPATVESNVVTFQVLEPK